MGDHYQPPYRNGGGRSGGRDHYDPYARHSYHDQRPRDTYSFRGAADRQSHQPPTDFTFRAPPSAPNFPPSDHYNTLHPPPQSRARRGDARRGGDRRPHPPSQRTGGAHGPQRRGGFRGRAAHTRDILRNARRETTPEQLEGMNAEGQTRFKEVDSGSDESEIKIVDLTHSSDDEDGSVLHKRVKMNGHAEAAVPKWSNPDPYTVLPPPETLGAPKKDIVQVIRKAKVDAANAGGSGNAAREADFISLNFGDDFDEDMASESDHEPPPNAPSGPAARAQSRMEDIPPPPPDYMPGGPPAPPPGFVMPSDEELMAQMAGDGRNMKRKRDSRPTQGADDVLDEWKSDGDESTPWCKVDHSRTSSTALRLHKEICDFFDFVRPYDYEEAVRRDLINRVLQATRRSNTRNAKSVNLECFGSFAAGLYLPTADMDLVAVSPEYLSRGSKTYGQSNSQMRMLAHYLENTGVAAPGGVAVITRAKVPIIKFADKRTGIKVDISFENDSGLYANQTFQVWKGQFPAMPVIVVLVKQLLAMRGLNEVYSGGIGGFTIICLVVSMMQLMPELQSGAMDAHLHYGDLLMNFLDLYGTRFDIRKTGIVMNPPGYFDKIASPRAKQNPNRLTIMDPNRKDNDISGGSHKIDDVLDCFRSAHLRLQRRLAQVRAGTEVEGSVLGCVFGGDYSSFAHQREKLSLLHRGYAVSPPPPPPAPMPKQQKPLKQPKQSKQAKRGIAFVRPQPPSPPPPPSAVADGQRVTRSMNPANSRQTHTHPLPAKPDCAKPPPKQQPQSSQKKAKKSQKAEKTAKTPKPRKTPTKLDTRRILKGNRKRAKKFKAMHPHVPNIPDEISKEQMREMKLQHGIL